jgi:hypothetical protein
MTATAARCGTPLSEAASRGFGNNTNKKQLNKDMKTKRRTTTDRLGAYLTATLGIGCLAGNSEAAIQIIDITPFAGPNGGVSSGSSSTFNFAGVTNGLQIYNGKYSLWGFDGVDNVYFAVNSIFINADIRKFSSGATIDSAARFNDLPDYTVFKLTSTEAPDFGSNSFVGFKANGNFGWLKVTWDSSTDTFEIWSGAYETSGAPILAGDLGAIPEPVSMLSTMGMLASGLLIRRRKQVA